MKAQFFRTTCPLKKLADTFLGPYKVIVQPGTHLVTLWLPDNLCAIYLVFHVLMLEPATPNTIPGQVQLPPPPIFVGGEPVFEIAKILNSKVDQWHRNCKLLYLVHWTGYAGTDEEPLGSSPRSSGTHLNWSWIIMQHIRPSWAPFIKSNTSALIGMREINHHTSFSFPAFFSQ